MTKGPLKCIGATTYKEYFTYFEKDAALNRRFQRIDIEEPSIKDTIKILNGIKDHYEEFHGVHYNLDSVKEIANLADRYITDRAFPDKAIDIMDDIGAICNRKNKVTDQKSKIKIDTKLVI